jgi:ankyrin repeat protein
MNRSTRRFVLMLAMALAFVAQASAGEIHDAAVRGDGSRVLALVEQSPEVIDDLRADGMTALGIAAIKGDDRLVRLLLGHRANPRLKDLAGFTPMLSAAEHGHVVVVKLLLDAGADP